MSTKSDERLLEAFESVPAEDLIGRLQAVAEAAVQAAFWRAEANSSVEEARFPSRAKQKGGGA